MKQPRFGLFEKTSVQSLTASFGVQKGLRVTHTLHRFDTPVYGKNLPSVSTAERIFDFLSHYIKSQTDFLVFTMRPLLIVLAFVVAQTLSYEIKATGGGIVKVGQDLELSLIVDKVWDRCRWFVYEHHKDFATCSYDLDPDTGKAEQHRCKPENTSDIMTYSGEDPKACTITVANVTEDYDCQWAARLDEDLANTIINVTVAKAIESISLEMERMVVGKEGNIKCKVQGGRPAPMINFSIEKPSPDLSNNVMTQEPGNFLIFKIFFFV